MLDDLFLKPPSWDWYWNYFTFNLLCIYYLVCMCVCISRHLREGSRTLGLVLAFHFLWASHIVHCSLFKLVFPVSASLLMVGTLGLQQSTTASGFWCGVCRSKLRKVLRDTLQVLYPPRHLPSPIISFCRRRNWSLDNLPNIRRKDMHFRAWLNEYFVRDLKCNYTLKNKCWKVFLIHTQIKMIWV